MSHLPWLLVHGQAFWIGVVLRRLGYSAFEEHGCDALWRRWQQGDAHENAWFVKLGLAVV